MYVALKVEVESRGRSLILDEFTKEHILQVARWLIDKNGKCGLLLRGGLGNGKTSTMKAIINLIEYITEVSDYSNRKIIKCFSAKDIASMITSEQGRNEYKSLCKEPLLAIDELGEEPSEIISYGMIYEPLKDLLLKRYNDQKFTLITSNLISDAMKAKYSSRITDRFREMMEIVNFKNKSYR